jgi:hypothetical protein
MIRGKCPDLDLVICRVVGIAGKKREKFIKVLPTGKLTRRDEKRIWSFRPMRSIHGDAHVDVVPFWSAWAILWPMKSVGGHQLPIVGRRGSANHVSPDSNHLRHQKRQSAIHSHLIRSDDIKGSHQPENTCCGTAGCASS